jgi:hypothetical protein
MVLLRWLICLNDGGSSGVTALVTARMAVGKSGQGGLLRFLYRAKGPGTCR